MNKHARAELRTVKEVDRCPVHNKMSYDKKGAVSAKNLFMRKEHKRLNIHPCGTHWHLTHMLSHSKRENIK